MISPINLPHFICVSTAAVSCPLTCAHYNVVLVPGFGPSIATSRFSGSHAFIHPLLECNPKRVAEYSLVCPRWCRCILLGDGGHAPFATTTPHRPSSAFTDSTEASFGIKVSLCAYTFLRASAISFLLSPLWPSGHPTIMGSLPASSSTSQYEPHKYVIPLLSWFHQVPQGFPARVQFPQLVWHHVNSLGDISITSIFPRYPCA